MTTGRRVLITAGRRDPICPAPNTEQLARYLRDQGAEVTLTSLFEKAEMTATEHEVEDALREGVNILDGVMPIEIIVNDEGRATVKEVREALGKLALSRILAGYRGKPAADVEALVEVAMALQAYVIAKPDGLEEVEMNPVMALPHGAVAVDALIRRGEST